MLPSNRLAGFYKSGERTDGYSGYSARGTGIADILFLRRIS
jgi:hypothetical protein